MPKSNSKVKKAIFCILRTYHSRMTWRPTFSKLQINFSFCSDSEDGSSSKVVHIHVDNADNFNSFNYWRPPLPEMDMNVEIVEGKPRAIHVSARVTDSIGHRVYTSEIEVGLQKSYYEDIETCEQEETTQEKDSANHSDEDPPGDAKGDYASSPKKTNDAVWRRSFFM